jgi:hypothetical protein
VVEVFRKLDGSPGDWLAKRDGKSCVVSNRQDALVLSSREDSFAAAEEYARTHPGMARNWVIRLK